jgi:hypothetical protein
MPMSEDKRRYVSRDPFVTVTPIAPTGGKNAAADGYTIRHRETFERKRDPYTWSKNLDVSPELKDEDEARFDSYLMD